MQGQLNIQICLNHFCLAGEGGGNTEPLCGDVCSHQSAFTQLGTKDYSADIYFHPDVGSRVALKIEKP